MTKISIRKVRLNSGGYAPDHGNQYFGLPRDNLYLVELGEEAEFFRANSREHAKTKVANALKAGALSLLRRG